MTNNKICNNCGYIVNENQQFCPNCGNNIYLNCSTEYNTSNTNEIYNTLRRRNIYYIIIIVLSVALIFSLVYIFITKNKDNYTLSSEQTYNDQYLQDDNYSNYGFDKDYIFPSDQLLIPIKALDMFTQEEIALIRNEIYAKHGYIFDNEKYNYYFSNKWWYIPNSNFSEDMFNETEKTNVKTIIEYETSKGWR